MAWVCGGEGRRVASSDLPAAFIEQPADRLIEKDTVCKPPLTGRSILIVEDEPLIDMDMAGPLAEAIEKKQAELDAAEEDFRRSQVMSWY